MRSLLHWGAPFHDQAGALLGMICTGVDISQHEHQLLLLKETNHKLTAVQDRYRRFLVDVGQHSRGTLEALSQQLLQAHEGNCAELSSYSFLFSPYCGLSHHHDGMRHRTRPSQSCSAPGGR